MNKFLKRIAAAGFSLVVAFSSVLPATLPVVQADELLGATNFDDGVGLPWTVVETSPAKAEFSIENGTYNITVIEPGGDSEEGQNCRWDVQFRHRDITIEQGHTYTLQATVTASNACAIYTKIGDKDEPYAEDVAGAYNDWQETWLQPNQPLTINITFTANRTADVEWAFHIGGHNVPAGTQFTFDNMSLFDPQYTAPEEEGDWNRAGILLNQLGYYPELNKKATLLSSSQESVDFEIKNSSGETVYSGKSEPSGFDEDSGDNVHILDFSDFSETGEGYYIVADNQQSWNFKIANELYANMLYDALNYFYQNRSGIAIESQYISSGDANALAREAGHNPDNVQTELVWGYTDSYTLDVTGGWYDAGDHGKYVVNGGISLWTMQNQYERAVNNENVNENLYADGTMNIPESGNGYPDILDEARYEMEFMLKMIVPDGYQYAGMVHHKVHDEKWTALATSPSEDTKARVVKPPTTAATLNTSACAAQSYRLWKELDSEFAQECLAAAEKTYEAAKKNPNMYAPLDEAIGGGAYGDTDVTDEFYWAACELYLATGDSKYYNDMKASEYFLTCNTTLSGGEDVDTVGSMDWGNTAALGTLSLAVCKDNIDKSDLETITANIVKASEYYIDIENSQGYGVPIKQSTVMVSAGDESSQITGYPWGSNSFVMNNAIVMAYAYDLTGDEKHLNGVVSALDYIMGRNPLDFSYVTGYGYHSAENPHHRWWSYQADSSYPKAPSGVLVGGPNSGLQDPWVKGSGWKTGEKAPQLCYMDNIEAWSVNECTINWNTPLAWIAGFMTEEGDRSVIQPTASAKEDNTSGNTPEPSSGNTNNNDNNSSESNSSSSNDDGEKSAKDIIITVLAIFGGAVLLFLIVYTTVHAIKGAKKYNSDKK